MQIHLRLRWPICFLLECIEFIYSYISFMIIYNLWSYVIYRPECMQMHCHQPCLKIMSLTKRSQLSSWPYQNHLCQLAEDRRIHLKSRNLHFDSPWMAMVCHGHRCHSVPSARMKSRGSHRFQHDHLLHSAPVPLDCLLAKVRARSPPWHGMVSVAGQIEFNTSCDPLHGYIFSMDCQYIW